MCLQITVVSETERDTHLLSEDDVALHQLPGEPHAVLDVDVVVLGAVDQHEPPVRDVVRDLEETGEDVAPGVVILGRETQVSLSVGRIWGDFRIKS